MHERSAAVFFFQAEDGIRDRDVTGVQTCALPILAAIVGLSVNVVTEVCRLSGAEQCNFTARTQTVIGGKAEVVQTACLLAKERGGRGLPMNVSGAFHTSLMKSAARTFEAVLDGVVPQQTAVPVVGNVTANPLESPAEIVSELRRQMAMPVLWYQSLMFMIDAGEIGRA